jgi:hypothetical protein
VCTYQSEDADTDELEESKDDDEMEGDEPQEKPRRPSV